MIPKSPRVWRALGWIALAATLALAGACRGAQPRGELAASLAEADVTFRLRYPAGERLATETRPAAELTLPGRDTADAPSLIHTEPYPGDGDLELDVSALPGELAPLRGVMAAMVRETYRMAALHPPAVREQLELDAAEEAQTLPLYWAETWDENVVELWLDGQLVAEAPVRILVQAALVAEGELTAAGEQATPQATETVPFILSLGRPLDPTPTAPVADTPPPPEPTPQPAVCPPPTPTTPAQHLVVRYLQLLHAGDHAAAYEMLAESYRLRLPYQQYQAGYEPVLAIIPCSLDTTAVAGALETVHATLRLTLESQGVARDELWIARYQVHGAGGASGVITSVSMFRAALQQD